MRYKLYVFLFVVAIAALGSSVLAHDGNLYWTFTTLESQSTIHNEPAEGPFKGFAFVYVTNSTVKSWIDFHFALYNGPGVIITSTPAPTMSQIPYTYSIGGAGTTLDYFFPSNPVAPGAGVTFTFYTDNTANQNALFGIMGYPTVPEPTSLLVLSSGLMCVGGLLFRKKR